MVEFERLWREVISTQDPSDRASWLFAAARRAPRESLGRLWSLTDASTADVVARGLAGRNRSDGPSELSPVLASRLEGTDPDVVVATLVQRMRVATLPPGARSPSSLLLASSLDRELAGARMLTSASAVLPELTVLDSLPPFALTAAIRPLAVREGVPGAAWVGLLGTVAARASSAPRIWGNAWIALRDGAPRSIPEVRAALAPACTAANRASALPTLPLAHFRCGNAAVIDGLQARLAETLACASGTEAWVALASQATAIGLMEGAAPPGAVADLERIWSAGEGDPRVLEAVAGAVTKLPVSPAVARLLRRVAGVSDPGVLAALLEGLVLHVQHAQLLSPSERRQLLRRPFELPEALSAEARVEALQLARALREPTIAGLADDAGTRAVRLAARPDAGIGPDEPPPPHAAAASTTIRFHTDAGVVEIRFDPRSAPRAVDLVVRAARQHRYDGLVFHRVVPGFVAQGGDPRGDGYGGTDEITPTELSLQPFRRGAVGIPLAGLDTGGIQLFVTLADSPHLDGRYPWVGTVTRGIEAVDGLMIGDRIIRAEVLDSD